MKEKTIELVRWICVLPAAMLGKFAGDLIGWGLGTLSVTCGMVDPGDMGFGRLVRHLIWGFPVGLPR